jgi:mannose-6-phosphate isomerase-like protein (cupin superfamily)
MKRLLVLCLLALPLLANAPQQQPPAGFQYWTPAGFAAGAKQLGAKAGTDPHRAATQQLGGFDNDYYLLAHREADGLAELHETEADVLVVESGSATLVVGGAMNGGETTAPHEVRGPSIQGGFKQKLSAGDIVRIPAKTPHQLLVESGHEFTYFVVKVKGY